MNKSEQKPAYKIMFAQGEDAMSLDVEVTWSDGRTEAHYWLCIRTCSTGVDRCAFFTWQASPRLTDRGVELKIAGNGGIVTSGCGWPTNKTASSI
jgi:hypothetical protein